jgi:hypothetical protein
VLHDRCRGQRADPRDAGRGRAASLTAQASRSLDTFAAEITEPGASLVLPMSAFGYGHDPAGAAAPGNVVRTGAALAPPHAAAST